MLTLSSPVTNLLYPISYKYETFPIYIWTKKKKLFNNTNSIILTIVLLTRSIIRFIISSKNTMRKKLRYREVKGKITNINNSIIRRSEKISGSVKQNKSRAHSLSLIIVINHYPATGTIAFESSAFTFSPGSVPRAPISCSPLSTWE